MPKHRFDPAVRPPTQARANRMHLVKDDNWIKAFLNRAQVGTVSTSWDNLPFNNVTLFWYDETNHRIIFHANVFGHIRANLDHNPKVCFSCYEMGCLLPSNAAIEFSLQYRSVVVFGEAEILTDGKAARQALVGLISKYFPKMHAGTNTAQLPMRNLSIPASLRLKLLSGVVDTLRKHLER